MKLFQNRIRGFREEGFLRIPSCPYSVKSLSSPPWRHVFRRIKISETTFEKGRPRNNPVKLFQNQKKQFQRRRFLKNSLKNSILLAWQPEFLTIFVELHPRNIPAKFYQDKPSGFGGDDFLKKLLTNGRTDGRTDGQRTMTDHNTSP